ncbi:MAG: HDOD domain-containing protein, partial [Candidatus Omnitrophica bacterium]|nr:HDOD domain-containing protein [Candidatus Omnitrophota bacterium]
MNIQMDTCLVPFGELRVTTAGSALLETHLGSCVGVCLFDWYARVGGLVHIVLPKGSKEKEALFPTRYASTAIPLLLEKMVKLGASRKKIVAEIAGGALMLPNQKLSVDLNIGRRNLDKVREILAREEIPIIKKDIGGNLGRVLRFEPNSGKTEVRYAGVKAGRGGPFVKPQKIELDKFKTKMENGNLSRHAACCAMVSELIARVKGLKDPGIFFTAGLLHDIGKIILDQYAFENFNPVMNRVIHKAQTFIDAENEMLGYNHTQVGGMA